MYMLALIVMLGAAFIGGSFGLWLGNFAYRMYPMKGVFILLLCHVVLPIFWAGGAVSLVLPVIAFLAGIGRKN